MFLDMDICTKDLLPQQSNVPIVLCFLSCPHFKEQSSYLNLCDKNSAIPFTTPAVT